MADTESTRNPRGRASSKGAGAVDGPTGPMFVCWLVGLGILVPYWQAPFLVKDVFFFWGGDFDKWES